MFERFREIPLGRQMLVLGVTALLISGLAYATSYALIGGEVVKTEEVSDASALAEQLENEIASLNAEAEMEYASYEAALIALNEYKAAAEDISGKYPNAAQALNELYDERLAEADAVYGLAALYEELADEKQTELNALNAVRFGQAPKGE